MRAINLYAVKLIILVSSSANTQADDWIISE